MKIQSLRLEGFQSHLNSLLELAPGVNVIVGDTDAGKSAIVRSLQWLAFNRPSGDSFVNIASKKVCQVTVVTDSGVAIRHRKPVNGYTVGDIVFKAIGRSVPEELKAVLHLEAINMQGQLRDQYFLVLDNPGEISRALSQIFGFERADSIVTAAKSHSSRVSGEINNLTTERVRLDQTIQSLQHIEAWQEPITTAENLVELLDQYKREQATLVTLVEELKKVSEENDRLLQLVDDDQGHEIKAIVNYLGLLTTYDSTVISLDVMKDALASCERDIQITTVNLDQIKLTTTGVKTEYCETLKK